MIVHRWTLFALLLFLVALPGAAFAQGYRAEARIHGGYLDLQTIARDSVPESQVAGTGLQRRLPDGTVVTCIEGDYCRWYTTGGTESIKRFYQEVKATAWTKTRGLSFGTQLRGRYGTDDFWPRSGQNFDVMSLYVTFDRDDWKLRGGRMYMTSGLGFRNFDGASILWRGLKPVRLKAYGGWSLAPGVDQPRNGSLMENADLLAPDRRAMIFGAMADVRLGRQFSGAAIYQREIRTDFDALYSERFALNARGTIGRAIIDGDAVYDLAYGQFNNARLRVSGPLGKGIQLSGDIRHYRPFFELWTLWGAFSPVGFNEGRLSGLWNSASRTWTVEAGAFYRNYENTSTGDNSVIVEDDGWRTFGRVRWNRDVWYVDGNYTAAWGFGAARFGGGLEGGRSFGADRYLALQFNSAQNMSEFRFGERLVTGGGITGGWGYRDWLISGSAGVYWNTYSGRPDAENWTQPRLNLSVSYRFGTTVTAPSRASGGGPQ